MVKTEVGTYKPSILAGQRTIWKLTKICLFPQKHIEVVFYDITTNLDF